MKTRIKEYSVGELARSAGVSVRLLHHYDAIGLLSPAYVAVNGYRLYRYPEVLKLQEILFYRATGMRLRDIAFLLNESEPVQRLTAHRLKLAQDLVKNAAMLATLDRTIAHLNGDALMTIEDLYRPFSAKKQAEYEDWLVDTYGSDMAESVAKSHEYTRKNLAGVSEASLKRLRKIESILVASYEAGATPNSVDLSAHQNWVSEMWGRPCDAEAYGKLSEIYLAHPDFIARYEALSEGFSQWLNAAMVAWSESP